jgi:PRTRC genetic system ThiF family protein
MKSLKQECDSMNNKQRTMTYTIPSERNDKGHPFTIGLIGAGGTGSQLLTHLARIDKTLKGLGKQGLHVTLYDRDIVTAHNMGRQLFSPSDIGTHKSFTLIERINRFFGTRWEASAQEVTRKNPPRHAKMIITCVDNVKSRRAVKAYVDRRQKAEYLWYTNEFWIDTGNNQTTGQIVLSVPCLNLPDVFHYHPDMQKFEEKDNTGSCSIAESINKQDLFINTVIAQQTAMLVWQMVNKDQIPWTKCYINLNSHLPIITDKLTTREPDQIQVQNQPRNKAAGNKELKEVAKGSRTAKPRPGIRRNTKSHSAKCRAKEKGISRHARKARKPSRL